MKFSKNELKGLIKEAIRKQMVIQQLNDRKVEILTQLHEMYEGDTEFLAELGIEEGMFDKLKSAFKGGWDQATATQEYQKRYVRFEKDAAARLGIDVPTFKQAVIKYMMDNGQIALLDRIIFDKETNTFKAGKSFGGPSTGTSAMMGELEL